MKQGGRRPDPVLTVLVAVALVGLAAILLPAVPAAVIDVAEPVVWLAFAGLCLRVARRDGVARTARVVWRGLALSGLLFTVAGLLRLGGGPGAPPPADLAVGATGVTAVGVAVAGWVMIGYPLKVTGPARTRLRLDVATVMAAFALLAWYLCLPGGAVPESTAQLAVNVLACVLVLTAVCGAVKLVLSGSAPFTMVAGLLLGTAVVIGAWSLFNMLSVAPGEELLIESGQFTCAILLCVAARVQYLQMRTRPSGVTVRARPAYSRMPYIAMVVTQVLLVVDLAVEGLTMRGWGVLLGAVLVSVLVMLRQNLAFTDNAALLRRLKDSLRDLRRHEERFRSLVQHASDLTLLVDAEGTVRYASPALRDLLGVDPQEAVGRPVDEVLRPEDMPAARRLFEEVTANRGTDVRQPLRVRHADGDARWLEALATNRLDDPSVGGIIINVRDMTEARVLQDRLRHQATHDPLTGLPNRVLLNEQAQRLRHEPRLPGRYEAVLMLDLDDFKAVNDALGHQAGDRLLTTVADRLRGSVRPTDVVARLGGDEFVVLLGQTTKEGAVATARRILDALAEPVLLDGHQVPAGASIGVAIGCEEDFDALMREADVAMYQAKRDPSGSRVQVVDHTAHGRAFPAARAAGVT
ncbi:diguanylate cyclase [Catellatospora sp. NPDC049609]|uniref:diguanylate cyclase domain-containing protein n=1 Tax=Catellatospora sp. NPDC049609 TaxID=3155505 RepID=UPI00341740D3